MERRQQVWFSDDATDVSLCFGAASGAQPVLAKCVESQSAARHGG
jgi:hypothetical protein